MYESNEPSPDELDIEKTWHGLHYLFAGDAWGGDPPLNFLVSGGREIGDVDVGYGPARGFTSAEVAEIAAALDSITPDDLRSRFDPQRMMAAQIYPEIWDRDPAEDDTVGYLVQGLRDPQALCAWNWRRRQGPRRLPELAPRL